MLFLFLLKGLFKRQAMDLSELREIKEHEQPTLFAFIRKLCEDAGAPFPGRIYLSADVNAAVFYPRSLLSLFWPMRKNLIVGLGLVTLLNLSELKAVLAHEFGHFAQSSMRLGRYVYVANQVIADMVYGRDFWDKMINQWCRIDLRLSFPAWGLKLVVWILRKLLSLVFQAINLLNSSLSRQMEFDADLAAVRLTGSDALISALWKSERGSVAYQMAMSDLDSMAMHDTYSDDFYHHQQRSLARLYKLLAKDPELQQSHPLLWKRYEAGQGIHFTDEEDHAGDMWSTHPSNRDREQNAKAVYVPLAADERTAWTLFQRKRATRRQLTLVAYDMAGHEVRPDRLEAAEQVHQQITEERQEMEQAEHYHGLYDDRFIKPGKLKEVRGELDEAREAGDLDLDALRGELSALVGDQLAELMAKRSALERRAGILAAVENGELELDEDPFELDGELIPSCDAGARLDQAREAHARIEGKLHQIDRASFRYHYAACAEPGERKDLYRRYRFLIRVQRRVRELNDVENRTGPIMQGLASGAQLNEEDVDYVVTTFGEGRSALATALEACEGMRLPKLAHLGRYDSVRAYVLPEPVVEPLYGREDLTGEWIGSYWQQLQKTLGGLRKLHFKNLGALLKLQERIDPELFGTAEAPDAEPSSDAGD